MTLRATLLILFTFAGLVAGPAQAALHDRGGGLIYDDVLNVTWLQDANYARTSGYDTDGRMNWSAANTWAANLVYGGYSDWRLPTMIDTVSPGCDWSNAGTDCGYNVRTVSGLSVPGPGVVRTVYSELAYMYYNLNLKPMLDVSGAVQSDWGIFGNGTCNGIDCTSVGQNNVGLIHNLQAGPYWSGLEDVTWTIDAWYFDMGNGMQHPMYKREENFAWAVRPGDVAAVPAPGTLLLLGLGLAGLGAMRRRG